MSDIVHRSQQEVDVVTFIPALRAYAWTLTRSPQDVDDLVQETLMKAIANIHRFQRGTNLRAWLMTIRRNSFFNNIAKRRREQTGGADCVSGLAWVNGTQEWSMRGGEATRAILGLPSHYRETLILVVMLGESYETAAQICGVKMSTIKSRVNRARVMVMQELGETESEASGT